MNAARKAEQSSTVRRQAPAWAADLGDLFRDLAKMLLDPYRPERHYMRGPGPRWHSRHRQLPALLRVRIEGDRSVPR